MLQRQTVPQTVYDLQRQNSDRRHRGVLDEVHMSGSQLDAESALQQMKRGDTGGTGMPVQFLLASGGPTSPT